MALMCEASEWAELALVQDLVQAHRLVAMLGLDDLTYTHISVRSKCNPDRYYIARLGPLFSQVAEEDIVQMDISGKMIAGPAECNLTGQNFHGALYRHRPDVGAALHTHTPNVIAVASLEGGLQACSQFSMIFYERVGYFPYDGLALADQGCLSQDPTHMALLMAHHGAITVGKTLHEALFYTLFLERAAEVQLKIMGSGGKPLLLDPEVCRKARDQMIDFEPDLGRRDWDALVLRLNKSPAA
jgi:ribulose-5-phosphate 4-epimerase/fuculose-1-phosphate aldolase